MKAIKLKVEHFSLRTSCLYNSFTNYDKLEASSLFYNFDFNF